MKIEAIPEAVFRKAEGRRIVKSKYDSMLIDIKSSKEDYFSITFPSSKLARNSVNGMIKAMDKHGLNLKIISRERNVFIQKLSPETTVSSIPKKRGRPRKNES